jgi:hypothetical protein
MLAAQQALNNDAVIKLAKAGLSEDLIVSTINTQPGTYDTSADGLIALKGAGVSDKVVAAIVAKAAGGAPAARVPPSSRTAQVQYKGANGLITLEAPVVLGLDTHGIWHTVVNPLAKPTGVEVYQGERAKLQIGERTPTFIINAGIRPEEIFIVRLDQKKSTRELQTDRGTRVGVPEKLKREVTTAQVSDGSISMSPKQDLSDGEYLVTWGLGGPKYEFGVSAGR